MSPAKIIGEILVFLHAPWWIAVPILVLLFLLEPALLDLRQYILDRVAKLFRKPGARPRPPTRPRRDQRAVSVRRVVWTILIFGVGLLAWNVSSAFVVMKRLTLSEKYFLGWAYMATNHEQGNRASLMLITDRFDKAFKVDPSIRNALITVTYQELVHHELIHDEFLNTKTTPKPDGNMNHSLMVQLTPAGKRIGKLLITLDKSQQLPSY